MLEHHRTDNSKYKSTNKDDYQKATSSSSAIEGGQGALDNNNNNTDVMIMLGSSMGRKWRMVQNKLDEATTNASMRETEYEERIAELECDVASRDHQILILKLTIRDLMQQADNMNDDGGTTLPMERSISLGEQLENNSNVEGRLQNTMKHLRTKMNNIQRQNDRLKRKNKELKAELVRVNDEVKRWYNKIENITAERDVLINEVEGTRSEIDILRQYYRYQQRNSIRKRSNDN
ncbi:hypothetical protein FOZ60_007340 [Perkinsus olseni]|uniref:Uncharacterized protein n=1 Tax=Perkinsus olseni TaxID=32597 RepID=A0A7J6NLL7_PEROL|nr:hypothetical protein FOZ60_007340 [Perkinsus olseni]